MPTLEWIVYPFLIALINWVFLFLSLRQRDKFWQTLERVTKILFILLLLLWLGLMGGANKSLVWFMLGLLFSCLGDAAMIFAERKNALKLGMVCFFSVLISYTLGINGLTLPRFNIPNTIVGVIILITLLQIIISIRSYAQVKGGWAVGLTVYLLALGGLLYSTLITFTQGEMWKDGHALLVGAGGLFFFFSDVIIAWDLFAVRLANSKLYNRISYHLAQLCIILGVTLHFLKI